MKSKKCKQCKEVFEPQRPLQYLCSPYCAYKYADKLAIQKERKATNLLKKSLLTHKDYLKMLQVIVNKIVRTIDYGQPCIATSSLNGKMNAGHFISVGSNNSLRFHFDNIHIQSEHSNNWKAGDTLKYIAGLESVYGKEYLEYVMSLQKCKPLKLKDFELQDLIKKAKSILKELPVEVKYSTDERIKLRTKFNKMMGIYTVHKRTKINIIFVLYCSSQ